MGRGHVRRTVLKPALEVAEELLPALPAWVPLDPDPTERPPYSPEERTALRRGQAIAEARQGPYDGERGTLPRRDGPPPERLLFVDASVCYRLAESESSEDLVVYRYSPGESRIHPGLMRAVEEAYHERGLSYAEEARHDDPTAPAPAGSGGRPAAP